MRTRLLSSLALLSFLAAGMPAAAEDRSDVLMAIATAGAIEAVCPMYTGDMKYAALLATTNGIAIDDATKRQIYLLVAQIVKQSKTVDQKTFCDTAMEGFGPTGAIVPHIIARKP